MTTALLHSPQTLVTADEFGDQFASQYVELIDGKIVEVPMPDFNHGTICSWIAYYLNQYILQNKSGRVASNDSFIKTKSNPDRVRGADVCYLSYNRWPKGKSLKGVLPVSPEIVFEVRSDLDRDPAVAEKTREYLKAGVDCVVEIDPELKSALIYRLNQAVQTVRPDESITIPDLLPDFSMSLASLFE